MAATASFSSGEGWQAAPHVVQRWSEGGNRAFNYDESRVPQYALPQSLRMADGREVTTAAQWPQRRAELLELFREHVYGRSPAPPQELSFELIQQNPLAMDGAATMKHLVVIARQDGREFRFELVVFVPNAAARPAPAFLLLGIGDPANIDPMRLIRRDAWPAEEIVGRGYVAAALRVRELAPDNRENYLDGVIRLYEGQTDNRPADAWRGLGAWAWGAHRAMDYFETDDDIDQMRVAVIGHSRGGKTALWAGAQDERFGIVISNQSGCGGAALSRRRYGETVRRISDKYGYWFCENFAGYADREDDLPVDQHQLIALIAPRPVYIGSADEDLWADPRGEFLALAHSSDVYALWGHEQIRPDEMPPLERPLVRGPRGYHIRPGAHALTPWDWHRYMDFADRQWSGQRAGGR